MSHFISIEGLEGTGKSTLLQGLKSHFAQEKVPLVVTREPGGTRIAEAVRSVLLGHYKEIMCADTELLLMFAGRAQNIAQVIRPALERGDWVLSDRFTDASFAYQGGGRGLPTSRIHALAEWVHADLTPNLTLLLDAPVSVCMDRIERRGEKDRIELESHDFFKRIRNSYLKLAKDNPERFVVLQATDSPESLLKQALKAISSLKIKSLP